ncbi:MAG: hypothetical protein NTV63_05245 [Candidatus Woesearchaeota archaeon]|nr:hypothetical protein [Candidatus Woesearchaeota archaeon]
MKTRKNMMTGESPNPFTIASIMNAKPVLIMAVVRRVFFRKSSGESLYSVCLSLKASSGYFLASP